MYSVNDIIVKIDKNEIIFYVIINITSYYIIVHKLLKGIKYILDENERLYKDVNFLYNEQDNIRWLILENNIKYRLYIKNLNKFNIEKYNNNQKYIEKI